MAAVGVKLEERPGLSKLLPGGGAIERAQVGLRPPARLEQHDAIAPSLRTGAAGIFLQQVNPTRRRVAGGQAHAERHRPIDVTGQVKQLKAAVVLAQGGPGLSDHPIPAADELRQLRLDPEGRNEQERPLRKRHRRRRHEVEPAGAQQLSHRPEDGKVRAADKVHGGILQQPGSPVPLEQVHLDDAPAIIHQPEALVLFVQFQLRCAAVVLDAPGGGAEMLEDMRLLIGPDRSAGRQPPLREVVDPEAAEQMLDLRVDGLNKRCQPQGGAVNREALEVV